MHELGPRKTQILIITIILAFVGIAFTGIYTIHLLNSAHWESDYEPSDVDVYDQKLQYDLGISGDNYENRELYTVEQYISDRIKLINYLRTQQYDMVVDNAKECLARYRFDNELLTIMTNLARVDMFENSEKDLTTEEKIIFISSILDPEMYLVLFSLLNVDEQSMLIEYNDVNILPGFEYEKYEIISHDGGINSPYTNKIGQKPYYELRLTYRNITYVVYMVKNSSLQIFKIDNIYGTMDGMKY